MSRELHSLDDDGNRQDRHLHEPILADPVAARDHANDAVRRHVDRGMPYPTALRLYGPRDPHAPETAMTTPRVDRMRRLEAASDAGFRDLTTAEQRAYVLANPDSPYARMGGLRVPRPGAPRVGGEATRLLAAIGQNLTRLSPAVQCDPAHAAFLHGLAGLARDAAGAVEAVPHHLRSLHARLRTAVRDGIPDSADEPLADHETHGRMATTLLEAARSDASDAGDCDSLGAMSRWLRSATDNLRLANHLQKGNARSAAAHLGAMSPDSVVPPRVRAYIVRVGAPGA